MKKAFSAIVSIWVTCIMATVVCQAAPAKYYFTHLGVEEGLSQNTVWCSLQDRQGFMWFGTKDGLNRYDGQEFRIFRNDSDGTSLKGNFIRSLFEDEAGCIWVGTLTGIFIYDPLLERISTFDTETFAGDRILGEVNDIKCDNNGDIWICVNWQGLFRYRPSTKELKLFTYEPDNDESLGSPNPWSLCWDREGNLWVGCHRGGGLNRFDRQNEKFARYEIGDKTNIYKITTDARGQLLVGTSNKGVHIFNPYNGTYAPLLEEECYRNLFVRDIYVIDNSEIWIGTESGLYIYRYDTRTVTILKQSYSDPYSLSSQSVYSVFRDGAGGMWVGTYFGGVNYYPPPSNRIFECYLPTGQQNGLSGKIVREFVEDTKGRIWIGTEDAGLNMFNPDTGTFSAFNTKNSGLLSDNIHGLYADRDKLYIGSFNGGLCVMDLTNLSIIHCLTPQNYPTLHDNNVFAICNDGNDRIWIGTIYGLYRLNTATGEIEPVREIGENAFIYDILHADNGVFYFAAYNQGIFSYNPYRDEWNRLDLGKLTNHVKYPVSICQDNKSNLWIGTDGMGLIRYSLKHETAELVLQGGLKASEVIYQVQPDPNGHLWVSTNKGLVQLNTETGTHALFTDADGLPTNQFNYKSGFVGQDGSMYFGTINGFIRFDAGKIPLRKNSAPLVFTDFSFFKQPVRIGEKGSPLPRSIQFMQSLRIKHSQASFRIGFALLSYNASRHNLYRYRMKNYDSDWIDITGTHSASYSNLPPGKYVFEVTGANSAGVWNPEPAKIELTIVPPFYRTTVAYVLYVLLAGAIIWYLFTYYTRRLQWENHHKLEEVQHDRERSEYQAKIEFFTNIAHEIRTPVTLIKGPFEQITDPSTSKEEYNENMHIMRTNIDRLSLLINQLLDFRKIESSYYPMHRRAIDLTLLIRNCAEQFSQQVRQNKLALKLELPDTPCILQVDKEACTKILCNLLDNAVKFAAHTVVVALRTVSGNDERRIMLIIKNDGPTIPEKMSTRIFDPFFQINTDRQGTGLGLSLVRNLVEQHDGSVRTEIDDDGKTCFIVEIPILGCMEAEYPEIPDSEFVWGGELLIIFV